MKKIIILLSVFLLVSASAGHATPITFKGIYATNFNLSYWAFNGDDGSTPSAKKLNAIQLRSFWDFKYSFLNTDATNFVWKLNMSDVALHKKTIKTEKRKLVTATKKMQLLPIETSLEDDTYIELMATVTSIGSDATSPIPEPAAMLLFGTGLAGLTFVTRRRLYR